MENNSNKLLEELEEKLESFFSDNSVKINIITDNRRIKIYKGNQIEFNIEINDNETKQFEFIVNDNYMSDEMSVVTNEAKLRGLDFCSETLRKEIISDIRSVNISDLSLVNLKEFIFEILCFQKLTKYILNNLKLPKDFWHSKYRSKSSWDDFFTIAPIPAGFVDGLIDEIITIDKGICAIYELILIEGKEKQIISKFEHTDYHKGLVQLYIEEGYDFEEASHKALQTTVSVTALLKGDELKK